MLKLDEHVAILRDLDALAMCSAGTASPAAVATFGSGTC
jgi:hypothetical protein